MSFSAIIFDMDGVFVDTEPLVFDVFRQVFSPLGVTLSNEYQYRFIGKPFSSNLNDIRQDFSVTFDAGEVRRQFDLAYEETLGAAPLQPLDGFAALVEKARQKQMTLALCTTTSRRQVEVIFRQIQQNSSVKPRDLFRAVITGNDVTHKKPHPEPYLAAAQALGVAACRCLAVEDSIAGVTSAKAAECRTAALHRPYNRQMDLTAADWIVDNLREIIGLL
jgi:beta-phosphoglucomutase